MNIPSKYAAVALLSGLAAATLAHADPASPTPVTGNVAMVSDYVFRGLTQSWGHPAIQGGADYRGRDGFAAGFWGSSISERSYPGGSMELDVYANYGRAIDSDWSWCAGLYSYLYPGANLDHAGLAPRSLDTVEANVALSWKWLTLKYNRALTDYFGADVEQGYRGSTRGTRYIQLDATLPLGSRWSLTLHAGHTHYTSVLATPLGDGARDPDYSDVGATLTWQLVPHWSLAGSVTHAGNGAFYRHTASFLDANETLDVGGTRTFLMLQGHF